MPKHILILLLFPLYAYTPVPWISQQDKKYVGTWECKGSEITKNLVLKQNGSYYHEELCFCPTYKSYGTWFVKNDTLVLMQTKGETDDPESEEEYKRLGKFKTFVIKQYCFDKNCGETEDYLCETNEASSCYYKPGFAKRLKAHYHR